MGNKTKHNPDYLKDKTADVIKHGNGRAIPNEQWEKNMDLTPAGSDDGYGAFNPKHDGLFQSNGRFAKRKARNTNSNRREIIMAVL